MTITILDQNFILHQFGAIFWEEKSIFLISDVHLGKVAHFRKHGMAIPNDAIFENFTRLNVVVDFFKPKTIIFLGDLFHSKMNKEWELFATWTKEISPVILDTLEKMEQRVNYTHYNPVEAEIVFRERDYLNSSFRNYEEDNTVFSNVNVEPLW